MKTQEHKEKDPGGPYKELPGADQLTKYVPADLQHSISQWDHINDLDREVFTIKNGAHLRLEKLPKDSEVQLAIVGKAAEGDAILLPGLAQGCVADIVLKLPAPSTEDVALYESFDVTIVKPKSMYILTSVSSSNMQTWCFS